MPKPIVIPIAADAWRMENDSVRCFLFAGRDSALLVDSGKTVSNMKEIAAQLTPLPIRLVNTHVDFDHIAGNAAFETAWMNPAEYPSYFNAQGRRGGVMPLWDGDRIDLGTRRFEVLHVPGHTPGSLALLDGQNRILVGGDGIQNGRIYLFGEQRSLTAYRDSLLRVQARVSEFDWVYPSHADFPLPAAAVRELIEGTNRVLAGKITAVREECFGTPIRVYDIGIARLLCEDREPY